MMSVTAYLVYRMIKEHAIDLKHIIKKAICILRVLLYIIISSLHLKLEYTKIHVQKYLRRENVFNQRFQFIILL